MFFDAHKHTVTVHCTYKDDDVSAAKQTVSLVSMKVLRLWWWQWWWWWCWSPHSPWLHCPYELSTQVCRLPLNLTTHGHSLSAATTWQLVSWRGTLQNSTEEYYTDVN